MITVEELGYNSFQNIQHIYNNNFKIVRMGNGRLAALVDPIRHGIIIPNSGIMCISSEHRISMVKVAMNIQMGKPYGLTDRSTYNTRYTVVDESKLVPGEHLRVYKVMR